MLSVETRIDRQWTGNTTNIQTFVSIGEVFNLYSEKLVDTKEITRSRCNPMHVLTDYCKKIQHICTLLTCRQW